MEGFGGLTVFWDVEEGRITKIMETEESTEGFGVSQVSRAKATYGDSGVSWNDDFGAGQSSDFRVMGRTHPSELGWESRLSARPDYVRFADWERVLGAYPLAGGMFSLKLNRFAGWYCALIAASRWKRASLYAECTSSPSDM